MTSAITTAAIQRQPCSDDAVAGNEGRQGIVTEQHDHVACLSVLGWKADAGYPPEFSR